MRVLHSRVSHPIHTGYILELRLTTVGALGPSGLVPIVIRVQVDGVHTVAGFALESEVTVVIGTGYSISHRDGHRTLFEIGAHARS